MTHDDHRHRLPIAPAHRSSIAIEPVAAMVEHARSAAAGAPSAEEADTDLLQVGDLARESGKTVRAIHLYEELGLLRPHARSKGRYRLFSGDAVTRVRWIGKLQDLGLSLSHIQAVVREWETSPSAPGAMAKMREVYAQKLASTRAQIERLRELESELAASLKYLDTCDVCEPARLLPACSCCEVHQCNDVAPELVAGFHVS